jgi:protein-L-isoaspartate(D-aspartate) O-methyltransferase
MQVPTMIRFDDARKLMVASQLRPSGVNDPRVIEAMARVPREAFVPVDRKAMAYSDRPIPLIGGREMNAPLITGRLLTELRVTAADRVLLIGAATGYGAALLAALAKHVTAVEEQPVLAEMSRATLANFPNVDVIESRLAAGHGAGAPYDVVMIDGAVERVPQTIVGQIADGGRLGAGLIEDAVCRLVLGRKIGAAFGTSAFEDGDAVMLPGFARAPAFTF